MEVALWVALCFPFSHERRQRPSCATLWLEHIFAQIDATELKATLNAMGQTPTDEEIFQMISQVDDDNSGEIEFSEFLKVIQKQKESAARASDETDTIEAFVALGGMSDKSGEISTDKLRAVVKVSNCSSDLTCCAVFSTDELHRLPLFPVGFRFDHKHREPDQRNRHWWFRSNWLHGVQSDDGLMTWITSCCIFFFFEISSIFNNIEFRERNFCAPDTQRVFTRIWNLVPLKPGFGSPERVSGSPETRFTFLQEALVLFNAELLVAAPQKTHMTDRRYPLEALGTRSSRYEGNRCWNQILDLMFGWQTVYWCTRNKVIFESSE